MNKKNATEKQEVAASYFADKRFDYITAFDGTFPCFAEDCQLSPVELLESVERAIRTRHHEATPHCPEGFPPGVWRLELDTVIVYYQVRRTAILIGDLFCRLTGEAYESRHDLMAGFEPEE